MPFAKGNKLGRRWRPGETGNAGGRPTIAREVRVEAQGDAKEAYAAIREVMRDKEHKQHLVAAIAVLKLAGVPMSADAAPEGPKQTPPPVAGKAPTVAELEAAAAQGEA